MSFSWWCKDKDGKDLFDEFKINSQALALDFDGAPYSCEEIRRRWASIPYKEKFEDAARDAMTEVRGLITANLAYVEGPEHPDCPSCTCKRQVKSFFTFDPDHLRRFLAIPYERVWRAGGGW